MATVEKQAGATTNGAGGSATIPVQNPATGETLAHVADMGAEQVSGLVERARAAQPAWEALGFEGRARLMYAVRHWLVQNRDRVLRTVVEESGKTREDAVMGELFYVADSLGFWAKRAQRYLGDEKVRTRSPMLLGRKLVLRHRAIGVVGVIGPWNYPLNNNFGDSIPALMAGNAVVLKPSEVTPMTSLLLAEGWAEAGGPEDVFQIATGGGDAGRALVDSVDMVHFTGSTRTGRKVAAQAAERLIPVSLELGGNDPMVVLDDAPLERAANAAVYWGMMNGGQTCVAVERVYVHEAVYERFVAKVTENVRALRQGVPGGPGSVEVGAITFPPQLETLERHVKDAVDRGAKVVVGGKRGDEEGRFFEPTVLTDVDHSMAIMREETFGPLLPIMRVKDEDEAVRLANDSPYGLDSSVWSKDLDRGERIARRIEAGSTCVNDAVINYGAQELPMGGIGESGIGVRHGAAGIQKYTRAHAILITRFGAKRELNYFPYSKRMSKLFERLIVLLYGRKKR